MGWAKIWVALLFLGFAGIEVFHHCELCHFEVPLAPLVANTSTLGKEWVRVACGSGHTTGNTIGINISFAEAGGKDGFEVTAASPNEHVAVYVTEQGGAYRAAFKPRLEGAYTVCIIHYWGSALDIDVYSGASEGYEYSSVPEAVTSNVSWCRAPPRRYCFAIHVSGAPVLPANVCSTNWGHGMEGSWLRSPEAKCVTGYCEGDLGFQDTDRWVWVPHECYLRLYNREAAWNCLDKKSVLWFGDSTLKQPATDLLEMILGVPVLDRGRSFNWYSKTCAAEKWSQKLDCPTPFALRRWSGVRTNPHNPKQTMTVRYIWGGAKTVDLPPPSGNRKGGIQLILDEISNRGYRAVKDLVQAERDKPDFVFVNNYAWYPRRHSWDMFSRETADGLKRLLRRFPSASLHFDTSHAYCGYDKPDHQLTCASFVKDKRDGFIGGVNGRLVREAIIPLLRNTTGRQITVTDRYLMSQPFSTDHSHCHFGLHYGSHRSFCKIFTGLQPHDSCVRDWKVDKLEMQIWLNKMCTVPPAASRLGVDIGQGVP